MNTRLRKELRFNDYLGLLLKHKWLLLFCLIAFLGPTFYFVQKIPDYYLASSEIVIDQKQETFSLFDRSGSQKSISYYQTIFSGQAFVDRILSAMDTSAIPGTDVREKRAFVLSTLSMGPGNTEMFLRIQAKTTSKALSYQLAKAATDSLIVFCRRVENDESARAIAAIQEQISLCERKRVEIQSEKNKLTDVSKLSSSGDIAGLSALERTYQDELVKVELDKANLEAQKNYFQNLDKQVQAQAKGQNNGQLSEVRKQLQQLEDEKQKKIRLGIPVTPTSQLALQITRLEDEMVRLGKGNREQDLDMLTQWQLMRKEVNRLDAELDLKNSRLGALKRSIMKYRESHPDLGKHDFEVKRLDNLVDRFTEAHQRLTEKLEEAVIRMQSISGGLKLVDAAQIPTDPISRRDYIFFIVSLIAGISVGLSISLLREWLDDTIKGPDDIEKLLALPLLGTIPHIELRKSDLTIRRKANTGGSGTVAQKYPYLVFDDKDGKAIAAESYRSLRTNIVFASPDKPIRTILITSSGPSEGTSLTMANMALSFAQQGEPTVLIDTDLRRPVGHHLFRLDRNPGFGNLFNGTNTLDEVVKTLPNSLLNVITAGSYIPNPAELLGSKKMDGILEQLKSRFRYILFDTPPVMAVTDSCILATKLDCVILVAKAGTTSLDAAERTIQSLNNVNANLLGYVLNDVNFSRGYNSYGYYKHYYHDYHSSTE